jgi:hypothetical protein
MQVIGRVLLGAVLVGAMPLPAQQAQTTYILVGYHQCERTREARADSLFRRMSEPVLARLKREGKLIGYGFQAHRHGGAWRRLDYLTGTDVATLFRVQDEIGSAVVTAHGAAAAGEFNAICGSHEDYLWQQLLAGPAPAPGAPPAQPVPTFSMSTYYTCDAANLRAADQIVERSLAPILDRHVAAGNLSSWSWFGHVIGGTYHRVAIFRAPDLPKLLAGSQLVTADIRASPEGAQFAALCGQHEDYIWAPVVTG